MRLPAGRAWPGSPGLSGRGRPRLPVGPQRHARRPVLAEPHAEDLVQLDLVALEAEPRPGHVQPPDPGRALADLGDRLVPVLVQVRAPAGQRLGVVLAQVLLVPDLEARVVHQRDQVAGRLELAVGEHVPVDEPVRPPGGLGAVGTGDAVVQQPPLRLQLAVQEREVAGQLGLADVLGQPDRADRVEAGLRHVPVVEVPHLGQVRQAPLLDGPLRPQRLLLGQRDAERLDAVLAGRVHAPCRPSRSPRRAAASPAAAPSLRATRSCLYHCASSSVASSLG